MFDILMYVWLLFEILKFYVAVNFNWDLSYFLEWKSSQDPNNPTQQSNYITYILQLIFWENAVTVLVSNTWLLSLQLF